MVQALHPAESALVLYELEVNDRLTVELNLRGW